MGGEGGRERRREGEKGKVSVNHGDALLVLLL